MNTPRLTFSFDTPLNLEEDGTRVLAFLFLVVYFCF